MTEHFRHYRVVNRTKQPENTVCMRKQCHQMLDCLFDKPALLLGLLLGLLLFCLKCMMCHK